jgi:hypothetical protein
MTAAPNCSCTGIEPAADRAVDGNDVAAADEQTLAGNNRLDRDIFKLAVAMADRAARHPRQQRRHFAARAPFGKTFEILTAGIHQRDDDCRQFLAEDQGRGHRQRGDNIEPDIALAQAGDDLGDERQQHRNGERRPDPFRPTGKLRHLAGETQDQPRGRNGD